MTSERVRVSDLTGERRERADSAMSAAYILVMCPNDTATTAVADALAALRKHDVWRQEVKRRGGMAEEAVRHYQRALDCKLRDSDRWEFWLDYADAYQELVAPHLRNLRYALKQNMDNRRLEDTDVKSLVLTAGAVLKVAAEAFQAYFDGVRKGHGFDLRAAFSAADLSGVFRLWDSLTESLERQPGWKETGETLREDERVRLAGEILCRKLVDGTVLNTAGDRALEMHPELQPEGWRPGEWKYVNI